MQLEREDQDVPVPAAFFLGQVRQAAEAAVHVGFTRIGHGADNVFPLGAELGKFLKTVFTGKPRALLLIEPGEEFVDVLPDAIAIQNFQNDIVAHGHGNTRIEKISCVNDYWFATTLSFKGAQSAE